MSKNSKVELMGLGCGEIGLQTITKNFVPEGEELGFDFRNNRKPMQAGGRVAEQLDRRTI